MNNFLTICMPSNRNFSDSKASISSAIMFCEGIKANLIISDNSKDQKKKQYLENLNLPFLNYISKGPENALENWNHSVKLSTSLYTTVLSDDDLIVNIGDSAVEYNILKKNKVVGIKPIISLWNRAAGIYKNNTFNIGEESPEDRILCYRNNFAGDNTTLFSFFDTEVYKDLLLLSAYHPTRGGYTDWSLVQALISSGKILLDPSKLLIYKNNNWFGNKKFIQKKKINSFINAGLTERGILFDNLFRAIDAFIFITRKNSPIDRKIILGVGQNILLYYLEVFLRDFEQNKNLFLQKESIAIKKIKLNDKFNDILLKCLNVLSQYKPELIKPYEHFYYQSLGCDWSNFS